MDQHDALGRGEPLAVGLHHVVLPLTLLELDPGDASLVGPGAQTSLEGLGDLTQDRRRGDRLSPLQQEADHPAAGLQAGHVGVEVHPVNAVGPERSEWIRVT